MMMIGQDGLSYLRLGEVHVDDGSHDVMEGPDRHMLEVREVLDHVKDRYYEMAEYTAEWTAEE